MIEVLGGGCDAEYISNPRDKHFVVMIRAENIPGHFGTDLPQDSFAVTHQAYHLAKIICEGKEMMIAVPDMTPHGEAINFLVEALGDRRILLEGAKTFHPGFADRLRGAAK